MKRYKYVLMIGGMSFITIGSYFGYAAMIKEPDYVIESVQGKASDDAVKDLHVGISSSRVKPTQYDIRLDGTVEASERNYLTNLYDTIDVDYPKEFYRFIRKEDVSTSEQGTRTYGVESVKGHINYQSYDEKTKEYTKVRLPYAALEGSHHQDDENTFQILSQDARHIYVAKDAYGPEKDMKILRLDIKKREVSEVPLILPTLKKNQSRTLVTANAYGTLYLLETHDDESIIESKYYLDDGKKVRRVKALDEFAYTGSMDLISDNRQLLMYGAMDDGSKDIAWSIYDFETNEVTKHQVTSKYPNQFGMTQMFNTDQKLYQVSPTNKSNFQVTVIDLTNDSIEYQGIIRDKNERKNFSIDDFRIEG